MSASSSFDKLGPLEKSALNYMNERSKLNELNSQNKKSLQDQQIYDFKSPDQQRKDLQLRAAIDKEEIFRTLDPRNKGQYNSIDRSKQEEIKKLALDREVVRQREEQLINQISKIQNDIFDQHRGLISRDSGDENTYARMNVDQRNRNELELAMNREEQVQQIRFEKDRLENERQRILQELNQVKKNQQEPVSFQNSAGFRKNLSAVRAGSAVAIENQRFQGDSLIQQRPPQRIEPSLKDKLIYDQARINKLREQQYQLKKEADNDLNNLDTLDKELQNHTNFYDEAEDFVESYSAKKINEKETLAKKIKNNLDMVSASPITKPRGGNLGSLPPRVVQQPSYQPIQQSPFLNQNIPVFQNSQAIPVIPKKQVNFSQNDEKMNPNIFEQNQYMPIRNKPIIQDQMNGNILSLADQAEDENRRLKQAIEAEEENRRLKEALEQAQRNLIYNPQTLGIPQNFQYYGKPNELMQDPLNIEPQDLPNQKKPIADEFLFRQNESRAEDLDAEERALMNLQAQEFDQLRIIERLPKDSEIYQYKLKQFKELSALRAEAEKVLHEQRIEKMKRDFEKQKLEEVRQVQHQSWLENQKRAVIAARLSGVQMKPNIPQYQNNFQATQQENQDRSPQQRELTESIRSFGKSSQRLRLNDNDQDENQPKFAEIIKKDTLKQQDQGFMVQVDYIYHLPSHMKVKQAKITICAFKDDEAFGTPQLVGPAIVEPDMTNKHFDKVLFFQKLVFKQIPKMADMRLALELQAFNPANPKVFEGMGWSWINIFEKDTLKVRAGKWTIPVYQGPTRPAYASIPSKRPPLAPDVTVSIRIGLSGDQVFNGEPSAQVDLTDFPVPQEHSSVGYEIAASLDKNQREMNRQKRQLEKQKTLKDINLDGKSPEPNSPDTKSPDARESLKVLKTQDQGQNLKNLDTIPKVPKNSLGTMTVRLLFSKNMKIHSRLQVRCTIHTGESGIIKQNDGKSCEFKSVTIEDNETIPIQVGQLIEIADPLTVVEQMIRNKSYSEMATLNAQVRPMKQYEFTWDFQSIPGQILLVEIFGKIQNKKSLVSYATFDIQNDKGDIQFGFHEIQLMKPDIKFKKRDQVAISGESFGFELIDPENPNKKGEKIKKEPAMRIDKDEATSQISRVSEQFIPNFNKQFTFSEPWAQADGLDIYFDGCRHLPDNVSVTKVQLKVVDVNFQQIAPPLDTVANIEKSSIRNQIYTKAKYQLGVSNLRPTALLYIKIFTIDESDKVPCCVGYSYFPLFMNSQNRMPVTQENVQQFSAHIGYYQMPIYYEKPQEKAPFTYERFIKLDRIPTSTVILRVQKAVRVSQQNQPDDSSESIPIYRDGLYSTAYCNLSEDEHDIMKFRRLYLDANLQDVLDWSASAMKGPQAESMNQTQKIETISNYISSAIAHKPINLEYFSRYFPKLGFRVNIEAIHNNQAKGFLVVMCSVLPSAQYYLHNPSTGQPRGVQKDSFIFSDPDFESHNQTYKFEEGDACVVGFEPTENTPSLFFDIKIYEKDKDQFSDYGFACMPYLQLFDGDEHTHKQNYVISGIFSLPVYRGGLKGDQMKAIIQDVNPLLAIRGMATRKDIQLRDKVSIIVRVVDQQRKLHYLKSFEEIKPNLRFLEQSQIQTHQYNKIEEGGFFSGPEKLKNLLPDKFKSNQSGFKQHLLQKFQQFMKL